MKLLMTTWVAPAGNSGQDVYIIKGIFRKKVYMLRDFRMIELKPEAK